MRGIRAREQSEAPTVRTPEPVDGGPAASETVLGRYKLRRRLGAGGFGTVFEAEDLRLGRLVALKLIHGAPGSSVRARREAMAAARLDHPGIVALFDAGEDGDTRYLVSELVTGCTLAELEAEGRLSDRDVLRIGLALGDALAHAHARGVVHRDVKPQNVIVPGAAAEDLDDEDSWRSAAKLADFGVASLAGDEPLTQTGDIVGTLAYMAPEQAAGDPVDARADVYAFALVLYEALTGVNPVRAGSPAATARRVGTVLPPLRRHRRDLPPALGEVIDAALDPRPERRPALRELAEVFADGLAEVPDRGGYIAAHPLERPSRDPSAGPPRGLPRLMGACGAGLLTAAIAWDLASASETSTAAAGGLAAVLVLVLGRLGWLTAMAGVCMLVAASAGFSVELAVLGAGLAAPALLLARRHWAWPVPALAPALGLASVALAFPALAGRAPTLWSRAALGALGSAWLIIAAALLEPGLLRGSGLTGDVGATLTGASRTPAPAVAGSAALLHAGIWSIAAATAPLVVRGRRATSRIPAAILWAGALSAGTLVIAGTTTAEAAEPGRVLAGGVLAALVAAWPRR